MSSYTLKIRCELFRYKLLNCLVCSVLNNKYLTLNCRSLKSEIYLPSSDRDGKRICLLAMVKSHTIGLQKQNTNFLVGGGPTQSSAGRVKEKETFSSELKLK